MSILTKSYAISAWRDELVEGSLIERKICDIGSDLMEFEGRVLEPTLTKNVNGTKKLTFKMYKKYIDPLTGQKVSNPFFDFLTAESKIKLYYEDKWYDFIIKNVTETLDANLIQYVLEDALVQELAKNGFGVTLDEMLINNTGDVQALATTVLEETDWKVESEVFVEKIKESLIYITIPANTLATHIIDQKNTDKKFSEGVDTSTQFLFESPTTVLAFYSSCKSKPARFQFIYSNKGYNKNTDGTFKLNRKDDGLILEEDCQYYVDFDNPDSDYVNSADGGLDLFLPKDYFLATPAQQDNNDNNKDSYLSAWYSGERYSFAQQSVYVPLLERYCQKFTKHQNIDLISDKTIVLSTEGDNTISWDVGPNNKIDEFTGYIASSWSGYRIDIDYNSVDTYLLTYTLQVKGGELYNIGGHNASFYTDMLLQHNGNIYHTSESCYTFNQPLKENDIVKVSIKYNKFNSENDKSQLGIYIQPNRGLPNRVEYNISELSLSILDDYLGYTESEFVSPTLVENFINNYKFESCGGWTATSSKNLSSDKKNTVQNVYGRFSNAKFVSISDDFIAGTYSEANKYIPYMYMNFFDESQFVLNSGIIDNRSIIQNMPVGEDWILDCQILNNQGSDVTETFNFELGEYIYNSNSGAYVARNDQIAFTKQIISPNPSEGGKRYCFTVKDSIYTKETFKKNIKLYLKIEPAAGIDYQDGEYYIRSIALYRKSIGADGKIIVPDSEENVETFIETGVLENKYHYFSSWYVDETNANRITDKDKLPTETRKFLTYSDYKPVYNEGARKIRSVSAKESNYFNILQSIAETFEAWLELNIVRDKNTGAIQEKIVSFKNYIGENNYAGIRYGVNLKNISRTINSKNIVTKLIVKSNNNELGQDGFCTIQRASANPIGENYIYDFQYYQNMGIMDTEDFLQTAYYIDGAEGPDAELWNGQVSNSNNFNLNGYYPRIKKINDTLKPISQELIGFDADLVEKRAQLEVEEATYEASLQGIEQSREDFRVLTGVYPEEAQTDQLVSIRIPNQTEIDNQDIQAVVPKEPWWSSKAVSILDNIATIEIEIDETQQEENGYEVIPSQGITLMNTNTSSTKFSKNSAYTGLSIDNPWQLNRQYILTYEIEAFDGKLENIGCHNSHFGNFEIIVKNKQGQVIGRSDTSICSSDKYELNTRYYVTIKGTRINGSSGQSDRLWIQPNRGLATEVSCIVSNVKLVKILTQDESSVAKDRTINFTLNVFAKVEGSDSEFLRTCNVSGEIPANHTTAIIQYPITAVDMSRSDVQSYITEYTLYYEKMSNSLLEKEALKKSIANKEAEILKQEERQQALLNYKKKLNNLFFKKYNRFIQEGTWIDETYVDDNKYFSDAQAVLYNSCYPQITYTINTISISNLSGYELFKFGLGDKTFVIDDEFFGPGYREEVIITEITENLDDPSKSVLKVQTFKNQFQDLFQKITATVQQTQYNVGSYEKGAALVQASLEKKSEFITNAINSAQTYLNHGQTVKTGPDGITITDDSDKQNQLRLVGGAILFSTIDDNTQESTWMTGVTKDGISANLITAGRLDAGVVQIMSGNEPVFRWDAYGISAYDALWTVDGDVKAISGVNTKKFVRFDKHGIYGINNASGIDGANWHPDNIEAINENATFALTWEGLKVVGNEGVEARIGKNNGNILAITKNAQTLLNITNDGVLEVAGTIKANNGYLGSEEKGWTINESSLTYGEIADNNSFILSPYGYTISEDKLKIGDSDSSTVWVMTIDKNFGVSNNGIVYAKNADIEGTITADYGKVGGWDISPETIKKGTLTLHADEILKDSLIPDAEQSAVRISCGLKEEEEEATYKGQFKYSECKQKDWMDKFGSNLALEITLPNLKNVEEIIIYDPNGWMECLSDLGYEQEDDKIIIKLYCPETALQEGPDWTFDVTINYKYNNNCFELLNDGSLYASAAKISGEINAINGKIGGWDLTTKTLHSYNGTKTTEDGLDYYDKSFGLQIPTNGEWAISIGKLSPSSWAKGNFRVSHYGKMYATGAELTGTLASTGMREGQSVSSTIKDGEFSQIGVSTDILISGSQIISTGREMMYSGGVIDTGDYGQYRSYYLPWSLDFRYKQAGATSFTRAGGIRIGYRGVPSWDSSSYNICSFFGTWDFPSTASATSTDSDLDLKKEIYYLSKEDNNYELLFNDLKPVTYQYKNGRQGRTHQGFIAQDVLLSLEKAQLTLQDFAALCKRSEEDGGYWGIRYEEFISLNTWQIQLLKPRMTAAEEKISALELEISMLKQELENLKNS